MDESNANSTETGRLVALAAAGEPGAFERLFSRHRSYLRKAIEMRLDDRMRPRLDASDVLQETQMEVTRRLPDYLQRRPMPLRLWFRKTAHERLTKLREQHVLAEKRAVGREARLPRRSSMHLAGRLLGTDSSPSERANRRDTAHRLRQAVAGLPEPERDVVLMLDFEGLSGREAALVLDIDASTVHRRHGHALLQLHKILTDRGLSESQL